MPPKSLPKVYQLLLKTHTFTIFLSATQDATIASVKDDALSAITSKLSDVEGIPNVQTIDDFEICREVKERGKPSTGTYEVLEVEGNVKNTLHPWDTLFLRFKDNSGNLQPVNITIPSFLQDDD